MRTVSGPYQDRIRAVSGPYQGSIRVVSGFNSGLDCYPCVLVVLGEPQEHSFL